MAPAIDRRGAGGEGALALGGPGIGGGLLPSWAPYGAFAGSLVLVAAVLLATGGFTVALALVLAVLAGLLAIYAWSRAVEGPRRAKDRTVTFAIAAAFGLAMIPLLSLIFEV